MSYTAEEITEVLREKNKELEEQIRKIGRALNIDDPHPITHEPWEDRDPVEISESCVYVIQQKKPEPLQVSVADLIRTLDALGERYRPDRTSFIFAADDYHPILVTNLVGALRFLSSTGYQASVPDRKRITRLFAKVE